MFFFSISTYHYIQIDFIMSILIMYHLRYHSHTTHSHPLPFGSRLRPTAPSWHPPSPWYPPTDQFLNDHDRRTFVEQKMRRHDVLEPIKLRKGVTNLDPINLPLLERRHFAFGGTNPKHTETILVQPNRATGRNYRNGEAGKTYGVGWLICTTTLVPFIEATCSYREQVDQARQYWQRLEYSYHVDRPDRSAEFSYRRVRSPRGRGILFYGYKIRGWRFCRHCHMPSPLSRRPRYRGDGDTPRGSHWLREPRDPEPLTYDRDESVGSADSGYSRCTDCAEAESDWIRRYGGTGLTDSEGSEAGGFDDQEDTMAAEAGSTRGEN